MALSPERLQQLKQEWADSIFDSDANEDHYDLKNALMDDLTDQEIDTFDENDFKAITGYNYEDYDKHIEGLKKNKIIEDFNEYKSMDMSILEHAIEECQTSWLHNALINLKNKFENLEHDGSDDLGYLRKHWMDRVHKRLM